MDLDIHQKIVQFTYSGSQDAIIRLGDSTGGLVIKMLKTGKMVKKPGKDGEIGIVRHVSGKGKHTDVVFTCRRDKLYIVSVNTGD